MIEISTEILYNLSLKKKKKRNVDFWIAVKEEYQERGVKDTKYLFPFTNTEHVEREFSSYAHIKWKKFHIRTIIAIS